MPEIADFLPPCPSAECAATGCDCMLEGLVPSCSEIRDTYMDIVCRVVNDVRVRYANELDVQDAVETMLLGEGLRVAREYRLGRFDRVDLLVENRIGIEVKVAGSQGDVLRQLRRYGLHERIQGLVLVTTRRSHIMPADVNGKPVRVVVVNGGAW